METITDWNALWHDLAILHWHKPREKDQKSEDVWRDRARHYDQNVKQRWARRDSSRDTLVKCLSAGGTLMDIGAGTGRWSLYLARHADRVTALDPSPAMLAILRENMVAEKLSNVDIVEASWPDAVSQARPHDFTLCAHAMYGTPDLPLFIRSMMRVTRKTCFLVMRFPLMDAVMADLARHIWGHPFDSTDGVIAYNVLVQMGIYPHILMEDTGVWEPWVNASLDEAVQETKRRFGLAEDPRHDGHIRQTLGERMTQQADGSWQWPAGVCSGLIYWSMESPKSRVEGRPASWPERI